ncbi:MAG: precorrin-6y C5,15-methyltransferase (decarboxylating) subunit CbiE [Rhodospirillaceae bacterium]|nr:precorrin-6y C5,15-methyltransferase (decarboxylating) subunit CbiE [Rhodospirillaceae bacterium]
MPSNKSNTPWITVIGIGEDGLDGMSDATLALIQSGEIIVGGERHLKMVADINTGPAQIRMDWSAGFGRTLDILEQKKGAAIVVLASGDPMYFGVGATLARRFGASALNVIPAISSITLACARMGWSQPDINVVTIHGRPAENINRYLCDGAKIIALSNGGESPKMVAKLLCEQGFAKSKIIVLENLGGKNENRVEGLAEKWRADECAHLNIMAIECVADIGVSGYSFAAGLADDSFGHDGQITKREVRAVTLAQLAPVAGEMLWDIGSGSGSIAIEWMRAGKNMKAIAIEKNETRAENINNNAFNLGITRLRVICGAAPDAFSEIIKNTPDAIFIGGGLSNGGEDLINSAWDALKPGGRLVVNSVTIKSEAIISNFADVVGGALTRINIERSDKIGEQKSFRPLKTVTQLVAYKSGPA